MLRRALASEIAAGVGGGRCGVAASLFVKFASQKTAAAEEAFQAADFDLHRKLSESARMDILYAREHAAKEAKARAETMPQTYSSLAGLLTADEEAKVQAEVASAMAEAEAEQQEGTPTT